MKFYNTTLPNGLQIVAELNPNVYSTAISFATRTGSRDETPEVSGVSHFLEHMTFKGTEKYTAEDVNRIFDEIGADSNAATDFEVTQYYAVCLAEHLPIAFEVLADIMFPSLREDDFNMEKKVILEEIGMYQDQPAWVAYERCMELHFKGHPLGNSILGTNESITALSAEQMRNYHQQRYHAGNIVLAVTGHGDWDEIVQMAEKWCSHWPSGRPHREYPEPKPAGEMQILTREKSLQEHIFQIGPAPSSDEESRYAAELLGLIVGDDNGSRLFWELVDTGLAEAAEISYNDFDRVGIYMSYLCCEPEDAADNLKRMTEIYQDINENGVTEEELQQAINKAASRVVLRSERPMGRLRSVLGNWMYRHEYRTVDDDLKSLQSVTPAHIRDLVKQYPLAQTTTVAYGPLKSLNGKSTTNGK